MKWNRLIAALVLSLCWSCAGQAGPETSKIEIVIERSAFRPAFLEVQAGTTVTFVVRNEDPIDHELIIGDARVQARHEKGTERHHGSKPGEISIPGGAERSTTYTFREPGRLLFGCHLPGHYDYGMKGTIEITR